MLYNIVSVDTIRHIILFVNTYFKNYGKLQDSDSANGVLISYKKLNVRKDMKYPNAPYQVLNRYNVQNDKISSQYILRH